MPRRFRISRIRQMLRDDPTATVELIVAFCYIIIPGVGLTLQRIALPPMTAELFQTIHFSEAHMGLWGVGFGLVQMWGAGTHWHTARALIATLLSVSLTALIVAYWYTGYVDRPTMPLMIGTVIAEMFIAWRCWHERPASV